MKNIIKNNIVLFLFFMSSIVVLVVAVFSGRTMSNLSGMIAQTSKDKMVALSRAASLLTCAEDLQQFQKPEDMQKAQYLALKEKLIQFTEESGVEFTYFLALDPVTNKMQFIIDNVLVDFDALNTPQVDREDAPDLALTGVANAVELGSYSEGWEGYITAFAPVYFTDGRASNYVAGVDMQDVYIKEARDNTNNVFIIYIISIVIVLATCLLCLFLYREKAKQSSVASDSKSAFLSNMSHEMRTPMNAIIGMTQIAKNNNDPKQTEYCLGKIDDAAVHLLGVINDILDISKIESGKFTLSESDFVVEEMLRRVANVIHIKMEEKQLHFHIKVGEDVPYSIIADQQRLTQVITNLLSNAVKFTPENGKISVQIHTLERQSNAYTLQIEVCDTGIGISKEQQAKLFQSFEQADGSISRRFGGTGLGLAICKNIIAQMGGHIWIESELEKGSRFMFTIQVQMGEIENTSRLNPNVSWETMRILVIDAMPEVRAYFEDFLSARGGLCQSAACVEDACQLILEGNAYDIVFVDWAVSGADGIKSIQSMKGLYGDSPIVIMHLETQWTQIQGQMAMIGVTGNLSKPLFASQIITCVNDCLGYSTAHKGENDAQQDSATGIFAGKHILLAEDVEINREILISLLEDTGVHIDNAENGRIACEMIAKNPQRYDLIYMDIHMPEMDGYQAAQQIRSMSIPRASSIPIIAMTANVFREDIEKCLSVGMNDHVGKPIDMEEIINKLKQYL